MSPPLWPLAAAAWPPPPQEGADRAGVQVVRSGAQGDLAGAVLPLPDGDGGLDPLTWPTKAAMSSASRSSAWRCPSSEADGGDGDFTAVVELQDSVSMPPAAAAGSWCGSGACSAAVGMPVSMRAAATRWVAAEVFLYTKQPQSVDTATYRGEAISRVIGASAGRMSYISSPQASRSASRQVFWAKKIPGRGGGQWPDPPAPDTSGRCPGTAPGGHVHRYHGLRLENPPGPAAPR